MLPLPLYGWWFRAQAKINQSINHARASTVAESDGSYFNNYFKYLKALPYEAT
jgi:hypothetical protein